MARVERNRCMRIQLWISLQLREHVAHLGGVAQALSNSSPLKTPANRYAAVPESIDERLLMGMPAKQ
jgi:hypothetical protein